VNAAGVRNAGMIQLVTTILKLLPLVALASVGLLYFNAEHFRPFNLSGESSLSAITATVALTLWAFLGLESATIPADHVRDPARTIPRATILGTVIAAFVYVLGTVAVMGILTPAALLVSNAPFADAARQIWGSWAAHAVAAGAAISCFGALNGWILLQGQIPLAAANDKLFPEWFRRLSNRNTPAFGIVFSSVLATFLICLNYTKTFVEQFNFIILLATLHALIPYALSAMSQLMIFIKERTRLETERLLAPTLVASLAFLYSLWAIAGAGMEIVYYGFLLLLLGVPVYVWVVWTLGTSSGSQNEDRKG
jgi:APA family basic amino acid/polyamine antiporter